MSAAHDYFYIIFNYRLKWTGTLEEGSLIFCQVPVIESHYLVLYIAELWKDGQLALRVSFTPIPPFRFEAWFDRDVGFLLVSSLKKHWLLTLLTRTMWKWWINYKRFSFFISFQPITYTAVGRRVLTGAATVHYFIKLSCIKMSPKNVVKMPPE